MARNVIEFTIKGINKFGATFKKFSASLKSMGSVALRATKWVAGAGIAVLGFTKVVANGIDMAGKFASRIGIAVDQLSKMQFAASQAGLTTQNFNLSVQRMTRRVAEATQGMGEAQGALRELGINAKQFQQLGIEDQFAELADRLNAVEAPADRLRLAFKLFDSEGTAVLQMLNQGSVAMRKVAKDAEHLGLVISKQAAADAEHFNDSMGRATGSMKGVSRAITSELMPALSGLANRFADSLAESRGSIVNFVKNAVVRFFTFIEVIKQVFQRVHDIFTDRRAFSSFLDSIGSFIKTASTMFLQLVKIIPTVIWEAIKAATTILNGFGTWLGESLTNWVSGKPAADFSDALSTTIGDAFTKASENISTIIEGPLDEFKNGAVEAANIMGEAFGINLDTASEKARALLEGLNEFGQVVKDNVVTTGESLSEFLTKFQEGYTVWKEGMEESSKEFAASFFNLMTSTIDEISNRMADAIVEGKSMSKAFEGFAKQVLKQLISMLIKMGVQRLVLAALTKGATAGEAATSMAKASADTFGNAYASTAAIPIIGPALAPGVASASLIAMQAGATAAAASGSALGPAITAREHGGSVNVGRGYLVGEKGPEFFTPNRNGSVISNDKLKGGISIGNLNINVSLPNIDTVDALERMNSNDWQNVVAGPIMDAFNELGEKGVKLDYV